MFGKDAILTALKLFIITAVAALCLAFVNDVTAPVIEKNSIKAEKDALRAVLPEAESFEEYDGELLIADCPAEIDKAYFGLKGSEVVGYVVNAVSGEGYGGDIKVMIGLDKDYAVTKIEILESSETAGLGANASKPKFANQFKGANDTLKVVKGDAKDGEISAISSATVTSKAVTSCVNAALAASHAMEYEGNDKTDGGAE